MLLKQVFKSWEGVSRRVDFENAHSKTHRFSKVRFWKGQLDINPMQKERFADYTWQIEKKKR